MLSQRAQTIIFAASLASATVLALHFLEPAQEQGLRAAPVSDVAPRIAPTLTPAHLGPTWEPTPAPTATPQAYHAPAGMVLYAVSPTRAVDVPYRFAVESVPVVQCESRFDPAAVGKAGELGLFQIHPIHRAGMLAQGLEFEREEHRIAWAVMLWERAGEHWYDWSCPAILRVQNEMENAVTITERSP